MGKLQQLYLKFFPTNSFFRNVIKLMSGTALGQGVVVVCTPLLTRIYAPKDFGVLTVFMAVTSILSVISCGRYELGIVLPEEDSAGANLFVLSVFFALMTTILTTSIVILVNYLPFPVFAGIKKDCASWIWYIPISLLVTGVFQALNYWATRRKQFGRLAMRQVTQSVTMILVQIAIGLFIVANGKGLIIGLIAGQIVATGLMFIQTWKEDGQFIIQTCKYTVVKDMVYQYRKFPLYTIWASLLNSLSPQLPVFFLSAISLSAAGYFGLATRVVGLPMSLIGNSVAQVFFADASEQLNREGNCGLIFKATVKRLFLVSLLCMVLVIGVGFFMAPIFGSQWINAGVVLFILIPLFFMRFLSSPVSSIFYISQRQDLDLVITVLFTFIPVMAFMLSKQQGWTYLIAILIYSVLMALAYSLQLVLGLKLSVRDLEN